MDKSNNAGSCACCCGVDACTTPDMLYIVERIGDTKEGMSQSEDVGYAVTKGLLQSLPRLYESGSNDDVLGMLQVMNALADMYPEDKKICRELSGNCLGMIYHYKKQEMNGGVLCALSVMNRMMSGDGKPIDRDIGMDHLMALECLVGAYGKAVNSDEVQKKLSELCDVERSEETDIAKRDVGSASECLNMEFVKGLEYAILYLTEHETDNEVRFVQSLMELFVGQFSDVVMDEMLAKVYAVPSRRFIRHLDRVSAEYHADTEDVVLIDSRLRSVEKLVDMHPESLVIGQCFAYVCGDMVRYCAKRGDADRAKEYLVKIKDVGEKFGGDSVIDGSEMLKI